MPRIAPTKKIKPKMSNTNSFIFLEILLFPKAKTTDNPNENVSNAKAT